MNIQDRWRDDPPPCLHCVMILDVSGQNPVRNGFRESLGTVFEFSWRPISGLLDQRLSELELLDEFAKHWIFFQGPSCRLFNMKIVFLEGFQESIQNETYYEGFASSDSRNGTEHVHEVAQFFLRACAVAPSGHTGPQSPNCNLILNLRE